MSLPPEEFSSDAVARSEHPIAESEHIPGSDGNIAPEPPVRHGGAHAPPFEHDIPPPDDLFVHYEYIPRHPPLPRKPNFGDFLLFLLLAYGSLRLSGLLILAALHYRLFGVSTFKEAENEIHYKLGSQAAWYLITLSFCLWVFPLIWRKNFFRGLQWRAWAAARQIWRLFGAAGACFAVAIADEILIPGPPDTPIDKTFHMPGAIWMLFAFGVTLAPLIEEITYRGFLLPSLCTACDWTMEQLTGSKSPSRDTKGRPRWSLPAMIIASIVTSIPFALMHGEQTAYSVGPFLLLFCISLVLCWIRLATRSLAASVLVHSSYNLLLFALMFLGTGGFRHLDRM